MPAARFSTGLTKIKKGLFSTGLTKIKAGYMYESGEWNKVWSFGSEVSYYDDDTLIGKEDVDEGRDVLHPSLTMPTKENYTFCGWTLENGTYDKVTELVATGQPMTLYAMYLPNSINVVSNSRYVSGSTSTSASATPAYQGGTDLGSSTSFTLNMREYQNNVVTVHQSNIYSEHEDNDQPWGYGQLDGSDVAKNSSRTFTNIANGTHTLRTIGHTANESEARNTQTLSCYVSSLILSNPLEWT